jgi:hypothetical protein
MKMRSFSVTIDGWEFSGQITSYDAGRMSGRPEDCYPPEIEWEIDSAVDEDGNDAPDLDALVQTHNDKINEAAWDRATEYDDNDP